MDERVFKRINFFKGFIRSTQDYTDAVSYHLRKQRLHNRFFHGFGVVMGFRSGLRVAARRRPDFSVEIHPGYAIDPGGRDIIVNHLEVRQLNREDFKPPQTLYLVLRYREDETDFRNVNIPGFPPCSGNARITEACRIEWTVAEPDARREVELARILITEEVHALRNAADPLKPRAGEIDLRFVPLAGVCGGSLSSIFLIEDLRRRLLDAIRTYTHMARTRNLPAAHNAAVACADLAVLAETENLNQRAFMACLHLLGKAQIDLVREAELNEPSFAKRPRFRNYALRVENVNQSLYAQLNGLGRDLDVGAWPDTIAASVKSTNDALASLHALVQPPLHWRNLTGALEPGLGIRCLDGTGWDRIKEDSGMAHKHLIVDDREWRLVDQLNLLDARSELEHRFNIQEARDWFRSQVKLLYPDSKEIQDEGIGHEGGFAEWEIQNLTPGMPVVVVRKMDYARGDYICRVWVNDLEVGDYPCRDQDTRYRWRNWPFYIEGNYVRHSTIRVKQAVVTANRDVNYFKLWFYQPI